MSCRTFDRRFARLRASVIVAFILCSSFLCSIKTSLCLDRLFCLRAEDVNADSESRRLESWLMRDSLLSRRVRICVSVVDSSSEGFEDMVEGVENWEYLWKRVSV